MPASINLADPDFEPSDDELKGLMTRAFAGIREARERNLAEMRAHLTATGRGDGQLRST